MPWRGQPPPTPPPPPPPGLPATAGPVPTRVIAPNMNTPTKPVRTAPRNMLFMESSSARHDAMVRTRAARETGIAVGFSVVTRDPDAVVRTDPALRHRGRRGRGQQRE